MDQIWLWVGFNAFVLAMLAIDLGVFHRSAHEVSVKEAAIWSTVWVALALGFNYGIYHFRGEQAGLEFLAGYLIEKALSVDNIFVFVLIFSYFRVPPKYQHRVLFWGILGGAGHARGHDRPRLLPDPPLRVGPLRLRRLPRLDRVSHGQAG